MLICNKTRIQILFASSVFFFLINLWVANIRLDYYISSSNNIDGRNEKQNKRFSRNHSVSLLSSVSSSSSSSSAQQSSFNDQKQQVNQLEKRQISIVAAAAEPAVPPLSSLINGRDVIGDVSWLLNYAIIGFPKTGTSSMMLYLNQFQPKVQIFQEEHCELGYNHQAILIKSLYNEFPIGSPNSTSDNIIRMIKCPRDLEVDLAMNNYEKYFPQTDFLVGIRHPVEWFQSFYNFRIQNRYDMPPPNELIGRCTRKCLGLCTYRANFHLFLANLGKTDILNDPIELSLIDKKYRKHVKPIQLTQQGKNLTTTTSSAISNSDDSHKRRRIFLWDVSQLSTSYKKNEQFRKDLYNFLIASDTIDNNNQQNQKVADGDIGQFPPMIWFKPGRDYSNNDSSANSTETNIQKRKINICDEQYNHIRNILIQQSQSASRWIREYFLKSNDVYVSSKDDFINIILKRWEQDPCEKKIK